MASACLNYGLQAFEGLKAFRGVDGKVRLFRPHAHARRMASGARKLCLPMVSEEFFIDSCVEQIFVHKDAFEEAKKLVVDGADGNKNTLTLHFPLGY